MAQPEKEIVVYGAGGHARVLIDVLRLNNADFRGKVVDDDPSLHGRSSDGFVILPATELTDPVSCRLANAVGSAGLPGSRQAVFQQMRAKGFAFAVVTHPSAVVASNATIGEGAQLMAGSIVQPGAEIGANTLINTRVSVDHDCVIGDHCHLAPGVTLSGNVTVGNGCHLGTGAVVIQGVTIGEGSFVAAGAVVTNDLPPGSAVRGVPARPFGGQA